mgnify:CR=1 FL=1
MRTQAVNHQGEHQEHETAFQIAVRQLGLQPSEFWRMKPRHFWWLAATMKPQKSGPSLSREDKEQLAELLAKAERGSF